MTELPLWGKRIGPWIFVLILVGTSWFVLSISPPEVLAAPTFALSFLGFAILARLWLPIRESIKGRRKARPALIGTGVLSALFIVVGTLAKIRRDLFLPAASGAFVGFFLTNGVLLAYYVAWKTKFRHCPKCGTIKAFLRDRGKWYCRTCGKRWTSPNPSKGSDDSG